MCCVVAVFLVWGRASARSPSAATGDPCSPGGCAVWLPFFLHGGGRRPDLLPQQPVTPAVLEDVLCGLFCFSTGAHGGWHEMEVIMHVLVQLIVSGSQAEDDNLSWPRQLMIAVLWLWRSEQRLDDCLHLCMGDLVFFLVLSCTQLCHPVCLLNLNFLFFLRSSI